MTNTNLALIYFSVGVILAIPAVANTRRGNSNGTFAAVLGGLVLATLWPIVLWISAKN